MITNVYMKLRDPNAINVLDKMDNIEMKTFEKEISKTIRDMVEAGKERLATKGFHIINMVVGTTVYNIQMFVDIQDLENVNIDIVSMRLLKMDEFLDFLSEFKNIEKSTDQDKKEFFLKCLRDLP